MEKKINWLITGSSIVVNYDGQTHQFSKTDAIAPKLIEALKEKRFEDLPKLIMIERRLEDASNGMFSIVGGEVFVDGVPAPRALGRKIEEFSVEGLPYEPLVEFAKNLQSNPSFRAVNELYQFLEKNNHPITDTGCFIAYKKVREDFTDVHSGKFDNSVGTLVEMNRNQVNENPNETCSYGLHVANWDYADKFYGGGVMLEVEVNPADVVSVPVDYNQAKMRVCKYRVLSVVNEELSTTTLRVTSPVKAAVHDESCECDEEDDDDVQICIECEDELDFESADSGLDTCEDCRLEYDEEDEEESSSEEEDEEDEEESDLEDDEYPYEDEIDT